MAFAMAASSHSTMAASFQSTMAASFQSTLPLTMAVSFRSTMPSLRLSSSSPISNSTKNRSVKVMEKLPEATGSFQSKLAFAIAASFHSTMLSLGLSSSSPIFNSTKNRSVKVMEKLPEAEHAALYCRSVKLSTLPLRRPELPDEFFSEAGDFPTSVKTKFNDFVYTVKDQQQKKDVATELNELQDFSTSIARFTDQSLEHFGLNASGLLTEINYQLQEHEKELDKAKTSGMLCSSILLVIIGVFAAVVRPLSGLAAVPFLPCFGLGWNLARERPIQEKLNDLRAINFKIHSAILEAGKIKDAVYSLSNFFTDSSPYARKVYVNFGEDIDKDLLRYLSLESAKNSIDFKAKSVLDKMKKAMEEEGASFDLLPLSEEVGDARTTTKRLLELGKEIMAAAIAQVEMAEHELSQIIHSVISSL